MTRHALSASDSTLVTERYWIRCHRSLKHTTTSSLTPGSTLLTFRFARTPRWRVGVTRGSSSIAVRGLGSAHSSATSFRRRISRLFHPIWYA